jgi:hypothetical protein
MKTYTLEVLMMAWDQTPVMKAFEVRANSYDMAAGILKGQAAINGWKILEVVDYSC